MGTMESVTGISREQAVLSYGLLAGGKSRRMGCDKAALRIGEETFLEHLAAEFQDKGPFMVAVRDEKQGREIGLPYIKDVNQEVGPMEGIRNLLAWSPTEYIFIGACDTPHLRAEMAFYLAAAIPPGYDCCAFAAKGRIHPLGAVYSRQLKEPAAQMIRDGNYRVMSLLEQSKTKVVDIREAGFPARWLENINTRESYAGMD